MSARRRARTVTLPSGATVHARGLRDADPPEPAPDFGLYLLGHPLGSPSRYGRLMGLRPWTPPWPHDRVDWPDFSSPREPERAVEQLRQLLERMRRGERAEVACGGGRGRTGTALAALAILDGTPVAQAIGWVRAAYDPKAIEPPRQHAWLARGLRNGAGPPITGR